MRHLRSHLASGGAGPTSKGNEIVPFRLLSAKDFAYGGLGAMSKDNLDVDRGVGSDV